jgi:hypothetical protein
MTEAKNDENSMLGPPKKPLGPFILFSKAVRIRIKTAGLNTNSKGIIKQAILEWKQLSPTSRKPYYD